MIKQDLEIIDNDKMINDLKIYKHLEYSFVFEKDIEMIKIVKYVYKKDGGVFEKRNIESPKLRCVFDLHKDSRSSFVTIYDKNNKEIFQGNFLWANEKAKSYKHFIAILKRLHDFASIKKSFN